MAVNDKIKYVDYNSIRNKVIDVLGPGTGNYGYGQRLRSASRTVSDKVGVNDWANLYYDIYNAYVHQTGSAPPSPGTIAEFEKIRYSATKPNYQYDTYANTLVSNRFDIHSSQSATSTKGSKSQIWPGSLGTYWTNLAQCTITVTFSTGQAARNFFNSGGKIRFTSSRSGGTTSGQNTAWTNLLNTISSINGGVGPQFGGNTPGTSTEPNDGQNYYRLKSDWASWYTASDSSPYGSNYFQIFARSRLVADNSGGTASEIQFLVYWADDYTDPQPATIPQTGYTPPASAFPPGDLVDGTLTIAVSTLYATGTLLPAGSGAFIVEDPTVTYGEFSATSTIPAPVYSATPNVTKVNEGSTVTFNIFTDQFASGLLYLKIIGTYSAGTTATIAISGYSGTYSITPPLGQGGNSFQVELRTGSQSGTLVSTSSTVSVASILTVDYLLVGGGGGGGGPGGGGGGAGGYIAGTSSLSAGYSTSITVGTGGAGGSGSARLRGNAGSVTLALGLTALGGGGGGASTAGNRDGLVGGSGGGAGAGTGERTYGGPGTPPQGNPGGGQTYGGNQALGGGGAGAAAVDYAYPNFTSLTAVGGAGLQWVDGNYYAGGGSGGTGGTAGLAGGIGGGGRGGGSTAAGAPSGAGGAGTDGTGGGGGGGVYGGDGGKGGNGVVIIRYAGAQRASGGNITSVGGYTYHTFYTAGTFSY